MLRSETREAKLGANLGSETREAKLGKRNSGATTLLAKLGLEKRIENDIDDDIGYMGLGIRVLGELGSGGYGVIKRDLTSLL